MEYYPRKIEYKLDKWLNRKEIILIKGPRQSGKTTLLLHLREKFGGNYITLEDIEMLRTFENNPKKFAQRFLGQEKNFLYIDEAQYSKNTGRIIKSIFDLFSDKLKLIVTGSGSFDVKVEIGKYLVGRAVYFELMPLDFEEFLLWKAKDLHKIFIDYKNEISNFIFNGEIEISPAFEHEFLSLLEEYIIYGGFPAIVKEEDEKIKKELLKNLTRTYLEKDVFFFFNIRHLEKFQNLIYYLSFNLGSLLNLSSLTKITKTDYKTLEKYLSILAHTYVIHLIPPFYRNLSTELKKSKKIYFVDTGMRNSIINNFLEIKSRTDKGVLFENFVLNELKNLEGKINYWRTTGKAEIDFILSLENEIIPVEVKSQIKLKKGFLSFLNAYKPKRALVFTEKEFKITKIGKTTVAFVPIFFI